MAKRRSGAAPRTRGADAGRAPGARAVASARSLGGSPAPDPRPPRWLRALTLALLAATVLVAFAPVLHNGWIVLDDPDYVVRQPRVAQGLRLDHALWFLSHAHAANWHPLTSWSHMLDAQLFGLRPGAHHAVSLLLHVLTAVLLALVLARMSGAWWRSLLVAALFALHPLRVESVAWIAERKDVLSGLLFVLALEAYRRWVRRPGRGRYAVLLLVGALGLMAKPMLVTLPFVLVLLDLWPLGRLRPAPASGGDPTTGGFRALGRLLAEKWPLFAMAAASAAVTFAVQRGHGAVMAAQTIAPARRVANAALSYGRYVRDTLWPRDLAVFHPDRPGTDVAAAAWCAAGLVAVTAACVLQARRRPYLATGWLWYVGMLVPVIGLVQVGTQAYADRYTYLPAVGLTIALVWLAGDLVARSRAARAAAAVAAAAALVALSAATWRQAALWKDSRTLFTHTLAVTPANPVARHALGIALLEAGDVGAAVTELETALRLSPGNPEVLGSLGDALVTAGRYEEAVARLRAAAAVADGADVRHELGLALDGLGRLDEAIAEYRAALRHDPRRYATLLLLAKDLGRSGRMAEAEQCLRQALALDPSRLDLRRLIARTLVMEGRAAEAIGEYEEVLRLSPDDRDALGELAAAYAGAGRYADAVRAGERAVALARQAGDEAAAASYARQLERYRAAGSLRRER